MQGFALKKKSRTDDSNANNLLGFLNSEELQLNKEFRLLFLLMFRKQLHTGVLFVCYRQDANLPILWKKILDALNMDGRIFRAWAVSHIDGILEHDEPVLDQFFTKPGRGLPFLLAICWQIEENKNPHNPIFAESISHYAIVG